MDLVRWFAELFPDVPKWLQVAFVSWVVVGALLICLVFLLRQPKRTPPNTLTGATNSAQAGQKPPSPSTPVSPHSVKRTKASSHGHTKNTESGSTVSGGQGVVISVGGSVSNSQVVTAGRDVVVQGNILVGKQGPPTQAELRADVVVEKNIPAKFDGAPPFKHYAALRVSARELHHPEFYLRITASAPVKDRFTLEVQNFPGGMRQMIATAIYGSTVEHTEGAPGLEPGRPWIFVIYADEPVEIVEVLTEDKSLFDDVTYRQWLTQVEAGISRGSPNAVTVGENERAWAARAVAGKRLAWLPGVPNTLVLPERLTK